jgi:dihydroorotate dehydrogenase (NAD+) catalytic subunit
VRRERWRFGLRGEARAVKDELDTEVRIGPLVLPNPIVAASGTFGHGDEVARLCDPRALGAVTTKSQAPFPWAGNAPPRLHPCAGGMLNAVGLQGPGVDRWLRDDLPPLVARGARVIASVWGHEPDDFVTAARAVAGAEGVVAVELNLSCPNLGHRSRVARVGRASHAVDDLIAHDPDATAATVSAVVAAVAPVPVLAKLSPNATDIVTIARAAVDAGATALTCINTVRAFAVDAKARRPALGAGNGGLSGAAIKPIALRVVHDVTRALPGVPVIGTGGVMTGEDAIEMLLAGATAVGVGTATFLDPRATIRIRDELLAWCGARGVGRVADLVGALDDVQEPRP